jgi:hypothetical protein
MKVSSCLISCLGALSPLLATAGVYNFTTSYRRNIHWCISKVYTMWQYNYEKRGNFAQNVKSCYEPVKFTCHIGNVLAAVVSITNFIVFSVVCATKWYQELNYFVLLQITPSHLNDYCCKLFYVNVDFPKMGYIQIATYIALILLSLAAFHYESLLSPLVMPHATPILISHMST